MSSPLTQEQIIKKVQELKASGHLDLSTEEDLSLAIMNLISLEEHFYFTGEKTGKSDYFDFLGQVREMRKSLLGRMMDKNEGETWCIAKHLLAATMRLIEVGTKLQQDGKMREAQQSFDYAYQLYTTFWALRLKLIDLTSVKKISPDQLNVHDANSSPQQWTKEDILAKLVDCCDE